MTTVTVRSRASFSSGGWLRRHVSADRPDRNGQVRDGFSLHVEELALSDLLGPERDLGGGLIGVDV